MVKIIALRLIDKQHKKRVQMETKVFKMAENHKNFVEKLFEVSLYKWRSYGG